MKLPLQIFKHELHQLLDVSHQESLEEAFIAVEILVLQFPHLIHDEDGFLRESAARKSDRSRIGAFLPDLFNVRYHCLGIF